MAVTKRIRKIIHETTDTMLDIENTFSDRAKIYSECECHRLSAQYLTLVAKVRTARRAMALWYDSELSVMDYDGTQEKG